MHSEPPLTRTHTLQQGRETQGSLIPQAAELQAGLRPADSTPRHSFHTRKYSSRIGNLSLSFSSALLRPGPGQDSQDSC